MALPKNMPSNFAATPRGSPDMAAHSLSSPQVPMTTFVPGRAVSWRKSSAKVAAQTVVVGNFGFRADPDAVIDDAAEVFGEMAVDVGRDGAKRFVGENFDARVGGGCGSGEASVA